MLISRDIGPAVCQRSRKYPVVSITGPRQSGKTTMVKMLFPDYAYVSLERPDNRGQAQEDPNRFIRSFPHGVILDEVQHVPDLFSYIQVFVDESPEPGRFILTGSQNFLLLERISQSLAGRVAIFRLFPFSLPELNKSPYKHTDLDTYMFTGTYPPVYDRGYDPVTWYMDYIQTYIERDVRSIRNVTDLTRFQRFLSLCAGRVGQLLNLNGLAGECGITHNTAADWMAVLEASYLVFRLPPHHVNFSKRVVKQSKLYFFDTGLLCALLGLQNPGQLGQHYLRGSIFESFIISEFVKARWETGFTGMGYFWRDRHGHEIDYLWETGSRLIPAEIKSGETIQRSFFEGLYYFCKLSGIEPGSGYLIYGGDQNQNRKDGHVLGWSQLPDLLQFMKKEKDHAN